VGNAEVAVRAVPGMPWHPHLTFATILGVLPLGHRPGDNSRVAQGHEKVAEGLPDTDD